MTDQTAMFALQLLLLLLSDLFFRHDKSRCGHRHHHHSLSPDLKA
jgi:hypothetical protein